MPSHRFPTRNFADVAARRSAMLSTFRGRPFTRRQALAAGLTDTDLRSHAVTPVIRGAYIDAREHVTFGVRCAAALLTLPEGSAIAGVSAAALHGLPVPTHDTLTVSLPADARRRGRELTVVHRPAGYQTSTVWIQSAAIPVITTAPPFLVEECTALPLVDAVVLADAVLRWCADRGVPAVSGPPAHWRYRTRNSQTWRLAHAGSESAMESRLRMLIVLAGLPLPTVQHSLVVGGRQRRLDLAYPEIKIALEYDGAHHFADRTQVRADLDRDAALVRDGWIVIHVVAQELYSDPEGILARISAAFTQRDVAAPLTDGWRPHFPQRARLSVPA